MGTEVPARCPHHGDDGGCPGDREVWARLGAFVAQRPVLEAVAEPVDRETLSAARLRIAATARETRDFADTLHERASRGGPPAPGSAKAVALSVAMMCRAFARNWADASWSTRARVVEFNRDVELLRALLDGLATRPESRP